MPDDQSPFERGRALLAQAFEQCEIPEQSGDEENPPRFGGRHIFSKTLGNDIGIVFS
jgi:hypothetical protein